MSWSVEGSVSVSVLPSVSVEVRVGVVVGVGVCVAVGVTGGVAVGADVSFVPDPNSQPRIESSPRSVSRDVVVVYVYAPTITAISTPPITIDISILLFETSMGFLLASLDRLCAARSSLLLTDTLAIVIIPVIHLFTVKFNLTQRMTAVS